MKKSLMLTIFLTLIVCCISNADIYNDLLFDNWAYAKNSLIATAKNCSVNIDCSLLIKKRKIKTKCYEKCPKLEKRIYQYNKALDLLKERDFLYES